jgi:hypothetical protein
MKIFATVFGFAFCLAAQAANVCVLEGSAGDGSAWDNALGELPATLARGNVYYIGDGAYSGYVANDSESGTQVITIRKATAAEHGSETGWQASYGDGQAVFTGVLNFTTGYWLLNGVTRSSWTNGHGFKIQHTGAAKGLDIDAHNVTVRYVEVAGSGPDDNPGYSNDGIYATTSNTNLLIEYCHIHDQGRCPILGRGWDNCTVRYCFVARNESEDAQHAEGVSLYGGDGCFNNLFLNNIWEDVEGTGVIVVGDGGSNYFSGNLIYWTAGYPNAGQNGRYCGNGSITSWTSEIHSNSWYLHNTVVVPSSGGDNFRLGGIGASFGNVASNNLFYCAASFGTRLSYPTGTTGDFNWYYPAVGTGSDNGEANGQVGSGNPFVSAADFRLTANTDAGTALGSPYSVDLLGNTRTTWTRGAYEFDGSPPVVPSTNRFTIRAGSVRAGRLSVR